MIPKTIHYCWFGRNPKPKLAEKCIKSWKKYCPDYEIIEWNEDNYDVTKIPYMKEAYEAKKWGFVPDYARLDIIYQNGGIYLDTDVELIKPIDDLLNLRGFAGFESPEYVAMGLGFGAEAGNHMIKELMDVYLSLHFQNTDGSLNLMPAPKINTPIFVLNGLILDNSLQTVGGMTIFPTEYFAPLSYHDGLMELTQNTYSIHHYAASWFDKKMQKEKASLWRRYRRHRRIKRILGEKLYKLLQKQVRKRYPDDVPF